MQDAGVRRYVDQHGRGVEAARPLDGTATQQGPSPPLDRVLHEQVDLADRRGVDERAALGALVRARTDPHRTHPGDEALDERVVDGPLHEEPVRGGARLAAVAHLGDHGALERRVDVGVGEDDERSVAAELHPALEDVVGRRAQQQPPDLRRPGERQHARTAVGEHGLHDGTGVGGGDHVEHAGAAGRPPAAALRTARAVSGVSAAGLSTAVHPAARAGAILRVAMAAGKFHGVMSTLTPTGWWVTSSRFAPLGEWPT